VGDTCGDHCGGELTGCVHAEVFASSAVRFVAAGGDADETSVLSGGCRDEHVVVSGAPVERRS